MSTHRPDLNKYERAALIGARAERIARGDPILIELTDETDALVIATKEFLANKIPAVVRRTHPDHITEHVLLRDLRISPVISYQPPAPPPFSSPFV